MNPKLTVESGTKVKALLYEKSNVKAMTEVELTIGDAWPDVVIWRHRIFVFQGHSSYREANAIKVKSGKKIDGQKAS